MEWSEAKRHIPFAHGIIETEEVAKRALPHYIFTEGDEEHREGYCTACEKWVGCGKGAMKRTPDWVRNDPYLDDGDWEYPFIPFQTMPEWTFEQNNTGRTLHNNTGYCPECGARVTFKSIGRGYKSLYDRRFLFRWHKSVCQKNTLVGLGYDVINVWRDFDPCNPETPTRVELREVAVIEYGRGGDRFINQYRWCDMGGWDLQWEHRRQCKSGWSPGISFQNGVQTILDVESFNEAISGTPFATVLSEVDPFAACEVGNYYDRITVLERIARYPCIEYMARLGYTHLAEAVIDRQTNGLVNLRGKTARSVLRLTQDEWGEVKGKGLEVTMGMLEARAFCREHNIRMNMENCGKLGRMGNWKQAMTDILNIDRGANLLKAVKYCIRRDVRIYEWRDQLQLMQQLGMDLNDQQWRYPKHFRQAHMELSARWNTVVAESKAKEDAKRQTEQSRKIAERIQSGELDEYFFSANGLVLRPMFDAAEVILEGSRQGHCVAGYVNTYANGNDVLCVLRYENRMDVPLYTVEFAKDGHLVQCRSAKNGQGPVTQKERDAFWHLHSLMREELRAQKAREEKAKKKRKETTAA